jgi:hypothetical protein
MAANKNFLLAAAIALGSPERCQISESTPNNHSTATTIIIKNAQSVILYIVFLRQHVPQSGFVTKLQTPHFLDLTQIYTPCRASSRKQF